jgi:hypothetical protein
MATPLVKVTGIGPKTAEFLKEQGIATAEELLAAGVGLLSQAPGFSAARAETVLDSARVEVGAEAPSPQEQPSVEEPKEEKGVESEEEREKQEKTKKKGRKADKSKDKKAKKGKKDKKGKKKKKK